MNEFGAPLRHPALSVDHAFGTRASAEPSRCWRPRQVHGNRVVVMTQTPKAPLGEADAVVSCVAGLPVGIVTADCVPILLAQGDSVAAIHAGWRGLANDVIGSAVSALDRCAERRLQRGVSRAAVIGPHICPRHYEIDGPVHEALAPTFGPALDSALVSTRHGHWQLDLRLLAREALARAGFNGSEIFGLQDVCTFGDARRFASRRRDGPGRERLVHWISAGARYLEGRVSGGALDTRGSHA